eukprot:3487783-Rhodomonas_salina.1
MRVAKIRVAKVLRCAVSCCTPGDSIPLKLHQPETLNPDPKPKTQKPFIPTPNYPKPLDRKPRRELAVRAFWFPMRYRGLMWEEEGAGG